MSWLLMVGVALAAIAGAIAAARGRVAIAVACVVAMFALALVGYYQASDAAQRCVDGGGVPVRHGCLHPREDR